MEMGEVILTEYFLLLSWTFPFQMYLRDVFEHFGFFFKFVCVQMSTEVGDVRSLPHPPATAATGGFELSDVGAGNPAQVLWKTEQ